MIDAELNTVSPIPSGLGFKRLIALHCDIGRGLDNNFGGNSKYRYRYTETAMKRPINAVECLQS